MEILLLKSSLCLLAFLAFYKVILERTSNHQFKRFYLLGVVCISIAIPFITFIEYIEPQTVLNNFTATTNVSETEGLVKASTNYIPIILWSIYSLGVLLFLTRFIYNLSGIVRKIKKNPKQKNANFISVLLKDLVVPHTFFSYIFLNKTKFENNQIPQEVLLHEQTHAKQKHSIDILCIEVLQIVFWFHPLLYLLKKDIKLNHEFLADQAVINQGIESTNYQKTLLSFSSNQQALTLEHAINYSSIKKRFTVMKTQTSKKTLWFRSLLLLPLLAILIFSFSSKKQIELDSSLTNSFKQDFKKELIIMLQTNSIMINGKKSSLKTFKKDINAITKNWKETDYTSVQPNVMIASTSQEFLSQVEKEFSKTHFSKANSGISLIPPPPPAPKVKKEELSNIPPPPPPIPGNATPEEKEKYKKTHKEYHKKYKVENGKVSKRLPPPPPPIPANATPEQRKKMEAAIYEYEKKNNRKVHVVKNTKTGEVDSYVINDEEYNVPPPPPPPKSPLDHVIEMAKKDADFYYEGKKITSDEAIAILKKDKELSISTQTKGFKKPMVNITTQPVITDDNGKVITKVDTLEEIKSNIKEDRNGYVEINGTTYFYSIKNKKVTLFNRWGKIVNEKGEVIKK